MQTIRTGWLVLGLSAALTACGGSGGDDGTPAPVEVGVPASAQVSGAALVSYGVGLAADDRGEPFDVSALRLPSSETDEPEPVDD